VASFVLGRGEIQRKDNLMKMKLERLIRRDKNTKNGQAVQLSVLSNNQWYTCWDGPWNQGWREGEEVEIAGTTSREYQGKTYWSISRPADGGHAQSSGDFSLILRELAEIKALLLEKMTATSGASGDLPPEPTDDDDPSNILPY